MRRVIPLLPPFLVLAACAGGAVPPAPPAVAAADVRAWFPPHGIADTIEVDAVERLPLAAAELIAPDGSKTPANYLDTVADPGNAGGQWAASHSWQNAVTASNTFVAVNENAQAGAALHDETQLLAVVSTADIPLPDPVAYRRDWQRYGIRLTFGASAAQRETEEIAAPASPPAGQQ
jgi:hypothetical protein